MQCAHGHVTVVIWPFAYARSFFGYAARYGGVVFGSGFHSLSDFA
jgi:hypothetical protein